VLMSKSNEYVRVRIDDVDEEEGGDHAEGKVERQQEGLGGLSVPSDDSDDEVTASAVVVAVQDDAAPTTTTSSPETRAVLEIAGPLSHPRPPPASACSQQRMCPCVKRCCVWCCALLLVLCVVLSIAGYQSRVEAHSKFNDVMAIFSDSNCTFAGNGTYILEVPEREAVPLDLCHPEELLLGTLFCRLLNHSHAQMGDILKCVELAASVGATTHSHLKLTSYVSLCVAFLLCGVCAFLLPLDCAPLPATRGAHTVVDNDGGWYHDFFTRLKGAYPRMSSHVSVLQQYGVPEGSTLETLLTGGLRASSAESGGVETWFQLEGAQWNPFHRPWQSVLHMLNYVQYKLTGRNVGPLGTSKYTDRDPLVVPFTP